MVKIIKKIFDVIFAIIIIVLALYFILRFDNRIRIYNVMTGSMEDNIHAGDYILIIKKDDYKVGDVVTFGENNYYITHRIIKKDGNIITTKGDANNTEDGTIEESRIVGKVILVGGVLNIIINYKYILVGGLLSVYLLTCYFGKDDEEKETKKVNEEKVENQVDEEKIDILEEIPEENNEKVEPKEEKISEEAKKAIQEIFNEEENTEKEKSKKKKKKEIEKEN